MRNEKQQVALTSVLAALFLVAIKIIVGVATGSLGVISEAAHSALDLCAAIVTLFAVRISDKPADTDHPYGHGKIESFSALIETALLLVTCGWISYEAIERLFFSKSIEISGISWGIGVMLLTIAINISRAHALKRAALKYKSQALEADALHFATDVWSSLVVVGGLVCVAIGNSYNMAVLNYGDPIAALGVSILVIIVSIDLGKRTLDVLLDTAPKGVIADIVHEVRKIQGVLDIASVRARPSGPLYFIDLNVGISKMESHQVVHSIVHDIRGALQQKYPQSDIVISTFPIDVTGTQDPEVYLTVKKIVDTFPLCTNIHNIHVYEVSGGKHIAVHIEVKENLTLKASHELAHKISSMIQHELPEVGEVSVNFEYMKQKHVVARDVTEQSRELISKIDTLINKVPHKLNCHDVKIYSQGDKLTVFFHCGLRGNYATEKIEKVSRNITKRIRKTFSNVESIHIHVEPIDSEN
jgi:cation diffusion facilitator family transporter